MNIRNALLPLTVAAAMVVPVAAFAQQGQGPGDRVGGQVTAVDAAKRIITVQGWNQTTQTIKVAGGATLLEATTESASDLKVGDKVRVMGQQDEDDENTIDARAIMVNPPAGFGGRGGRRGGPGGPGGGPGRGPGGGGRRGGTVGTIATITPTLTVTTADNQTKTIDTTDDTRIMTFKTAAFGDIAIGKMVMAELKDGVATHLQIMPAMGGGGGWRRGGGGGGGGGQ